jgi:hypothetical protein
MMPIPKMMPIRIGYLNYRQFTEEYDNELQNIYNSLKNFDELYFDTLSFEIFNKFIYKEFYIKPY